MITSSDISAALSELGIKAGDICLFHSSYKSLGPVDGGAAAVIAGFESLLGKEGTLVAPTLCQVDFKNSYKTWYMDKPSDAGWLTEYFRKQPYVYRSNQATHSVAARGKLAYELTYEHTAGKPRLCPFGEYAFCDTSPWYKMYERNAKVVFVGVSMMYHTFKHMLEGMFLESLLNAVPDKARADEYRSRLMVFERFGEGLWPFYDAVAMQSALEEAGLVRKTNCGNAELLCIEARPSSEEVLRQLNANPERYIGQPMLDWIHEVRALAEKNK